MHYEKLVTFNGHLPTSLDSSSVYFPLLSLLQLNLTLNSGEGGDISTFTENGEWSLLGEQSPHPCAIRAQQQRQQSENWVSLNCPAFNIFKNY